MESHLLTAIVPVGPAHILKNRLRNWTEEANRFSSELKLIIVLDTNDPEVMKQVDFNGFVHAEIVQGNFGSPGSARNAGLKNINSRWTCFWDCDDEPEIQRFIDMVKAADSQKYEVAIGNFEILSSSNLEESKAFFHDGNLSIVADNPGIWRMAFSQHINSSEVFENLRMAEDQIYILDLKLPTRKIYFEEKEVYSYLNYEVGQLTKNKEALKRIPEAISLIKNRINLGRIPTNEFSIKILARIYLTALKKGSLLTKISVAIDYMKYIINQNQVRMPLIKATIKVISTKYN
jgi:glycosyltransferase involved in cell wall biosynthesis